MSKKRRDEKINPYNVLGVTDERANEMSAELRTLDSESQYLDEVMTTLAKRYDPDSLAMGLFLAVLVMQMDGRLLPPGVRCTEIYPDTN